MVHRRLAGLVLSARRFDVVVPVVGPGGIWHPRGGGPRHGSGGPPPSHARRRHGGPPIRAIWILGALHWGGLALALAASWFYGRLLVREGGSTHAQRRALLWSATGLMTLAIAVRTAQLGTIPLHSPLEALYFYAWLLFLVYLGLVRSPRQASVGALLVPFGALCALVSVIGFDPDVRVSALFHDPLFSIHTLTAFLGYSSLSVACAAGVLYLVLNDQLRRKRLGRLFERLPPLADLDRLGHRTVLLGLGLLTVAIVSGAVWARREWGVNWIWEPKAVWSVLSWLIYAGYLVARRAPRWRGERAAWLATAGFAASIFTFLGTNYLLGTGRHVF